VKFHSIVKYDREIRNCRGQTVFVQLRPIFTKIKHYYLPYFIDQKSDYS